MTRTRRVVVAGAVLIAIAIAVGAAALLGVRLFVIESPSMGRAAPVGSLVVGLPVAPDDIHVGDIVTYHAPGSVRTYTHRVVERIAAGFRIRGDLNGSSDPWVVAPARIVTRAAWILPGVGYLVRAAPLLGIGGGVLALLTFRIRNETARISLRMLGSSALIAACGLLLKPFTGFAVLGSTMVDGGMRTTVVSTAVLPLRLTSGGTSVELLSGAEATMLLRPDAVGRVSMASSLALDPAGWCALLAICLIPTIWVLLAGPVPLTRGRSAPG